jgi:hypothetical protein
MEAMPMAHRPPDGSAEESLYMDQHYFMGPQANLPYLVCLIPQHLDALARSLLMLRQERLLPAGIEKNPLRRPNMIA